MRSMIIRADASLTIGTGHIMRCLTLATVLRERDAEVSFVCREHEGHLCDLIVERGFIASRLPVPKAGYRAESGPAHAAWLGASSPEDSEQTRAVIEALGVKPDWLVIDHYAIDHRWESSMRKSVARIMVIDDLADRVHDCDLLLDQNLVAGMDTRYDNKVPATCAKLLGPDFALLQPIYAELHERMPPREGPIRRIVILFGGADIDNLTGRTLAAFLGLKRSEIEVDVVITPGGPHAEAIRQQVTKHGNIHLHSNLPTLAPLLAKADLAIGAGGATSWERLCLGLPTLVITLAENQGAIANELCRCGLVRLLGYKDVVNESMIAGVLEELIRQGLEEDWSLRCMTAVDGKGANRVCATLAVTATTPLRVRHATLKDETLLLNWANDPATRRNGFSPGLIPAAAHRIWFREHLRSLDDCRLYVVETIEGIALGQVRFQRHDQAWEVHYALAPVFRGRGLGRSMLEAALRRFRAELEGAWIFGKVKSGNRHSQRIFESLGFATLPDSEVDVAVYGRAL